MSQPKRGSLIVAGAGIAYAGHCSVEARNAIASADIVLSIMGDELMQQWLSELNPNTRSMQDFYAQKQTRLDAYEAMVEELLSQVRKGLDVCAVFYGHAGVFVTPSHEAVRRARAEGYDAMMLAGISAEDCLYADLGLDPGAWGCQSYEAHDFFLRRPKFDTGSSLILWQLSVLGDQTFRRLEADAAAIGALAEQLMQHYPDDHCVIVYAASVLPVTPASIQELHLKELRTAEITQASTLWVPPLAA